VACNQLTKISDPDVVLSSTINDSAGAVLQFNGAVILFATAYPYQVKEAGLITDELSAIGSGVGQTPEDQRIVPPGVASAYPWDKLSAARVNALLAIAALQRYSPQPASNIGALFAYVGFVDTFFAENLCSGTPLAVTTTGSPAFGPTVARPGVLQQAILSFDSAAAYSGGADSIVFLANVGKGRALLDSGDYADAASAVAAVPLNFQYLVQFGGTTSQFNAIYQYAFQFGIIQVSNVEGINGLNFASAGDPRVPINSTSGAALPAADSSLTTPIALANGIEAGLIAAEAQLKAGQISQWSATLNALRATVPGLTPLPADSTTAASASEQLGVMFRERAFWLFLTGHRQGDMLRLISQYGMATESVFPTGLYEGGPNQYGTAVVYQPFNEQQNPNYHGCFSNP
jgi:hypothetical protein